MTDKPLSIGFAGLSFSITTPDDSIRSHLEDRYGAFRSQDGAPACALRVSPDSSLDQSDPNNIEISLGGDVIIAESSSLKLEFEFDGGTGAGVLCVSPQELFIDIENSLRVLVAHSVIRRGMLLVHGAAFTRADGVSIDLFAGYSGSGKSTISRLAAGAGRTVLSDDIILLDPGGDCVSAVSTPLGSREGPAPEPRKPGPVSTLHFLEHGDRNEVRKLEPPEALLRLATVVPFTPSAGTEAFQKVLEVAARVVDKLDFAVLFFRPDSSVMAFLKKEQA
ncbi:MAG: hypothetical protein ACYS8W_06270 [Planctomycetota bacterium]|jgi:hypothetical protein